MSFGVRICDYGFFKENFIGKLMFMEKGYDFSCGGILVFGFCLYWEIIFGCYSGEFWLGMCLVEKEKLCTDMEGKRLTVL